MYCHEETDQIILHSIAHVHRFIVLAPPNYQDMGSYRMLKSALPLVEKELLDCSQITPERIDTRRAMRALFDLEKGSNDELMQKAKCIFGVTGLPFRDRHLQKDIIECCNRLMIALSYSLDLV
jgi:hypothetical protein